MKEEARKAMKCGKRGGMEAGLLPWSNLVKMQKCFEKHSFNRPREPSETPDGEETSGEIMLGSTQKALREIRFNLLSLD